MGKSMVHRIGLGLFLTGFASSAAAQVYIGAALGKTEYKDAEEFGVDDESSALEMNFGVHLQDTLALEVSYLNLGDVTDFYLGSDVNVSGVTLSGKALIPISREVDLYGKMGVYFWEMDEIYRNQSYYLDEGEDLIYGGGATFHLHQFDLNVEYRTFDLYDMGTSLITVGLSFEF